MRGMHQRPSDHYVGMRVVTARNARYDLQGLSTFEEIRVERIVQLDQEAIRRGHHARAVLEHEGVERDVILCNGTFAEDAPMRVIWTDPLPGDDAAAVELVSGANSGRNGKQATLLWVGAIADGIAYCHVVTDTFHLDDGVTDDGAMGHCDRAIAVQAWDGAAAGSLVVCMLRRAHVRDGLIVHAVKGVRTVMENVTLKEAVKLPCDRRSRRNTLSRGNFAGMFEVIEAEDRARAEAQPSEALVLRWRDGDQEMTNILSSTGIAFHRNDEPESYVEGAIEALGLWMFVDANIVSTTDHEGEHDSYMEGSTRPATMDDVLRAFGTDYDAEREIYEMTGFDCSGMLADILSGRMPADLQGNVEIKTAA